MRKVGIPFIIIGAAILLAVALTAPAQAQTGLQSDPAAHGKYLATIAGCGGCHTPLKPDGAPDETKSYAGGREFDLGPLGKIRSSNLTSDKDTGLGNWTHDEIEIAMQMGVTPQKHYLFPIMPYTYFHNLAESDLDDIVAYLRTLPAISNKVEYRQVLPPEALPKLSPPTADLKSPDPSDTAARGKYLLNALIACSDCHTPVDAQSGQPELQKYLAGGQPYEGPWGIVYSANLTPDQETGFGKWSDADIARVFHEGVLPDGRKVVLMPWQDFQIVTDQDLAAITHYLRNDVKPVVNVVPANKLNAPFIQYVEISKPTAGPSLGQIALTVVGAIVVAAGVAVMVVMSRRANKR